MLGGFQKVENSVIVGTTDNTGNGGDIKILKDGKWVWEHNDVSFPKPSNPSQEQIGIYINAEGPSHFENVEFRNFKTDEYNTKAGIKFRDDYNFHNGATTSNLCKGSFFQL